MPSPVEFSPNIAPKTENPFCCIGCCSLGEVNIIDPGSSQGQQQKQTTSQAGGMAGQGAVGGTSSSVFAVTTQPQSGAGGESVDWLRVESSIEQQVDQIAIGILSSERSGRCCTVLYDTCSPRCTASPGCLFCGCSKGECGCGGCGRLLCGMLDACCVVGAGGSRLKLSAFHRGLKQRFSGRVISLAEEETGINLQDLMIQGRAPTSNEKDRLEEACVRIHSTLCLALGQSCEDGWKEDQDNCLCLFDDPVWCDAIKKAGSQNESNSRSKVKNVLIVSSCGGSSSSCEAYSTQKLGNEISALKVITQNGVQGILGVFEGSLIAQIINEIIFHNPTNQGNFWLSQEELRQLVSIVLAIRGLSFQDTEGNTSTTVTHPKIEKLRKDFRKNSGCLMMTSSALLCRPSIFASEEEDILITSMTGDVLKDKIGKKMGRNVEMQLKKRYFDARKRIADKQEDDQKIVTKQPQPRSSGDEDSSPTLSHSI